jgi:hypothetical protein
MRYRGWSKGLLVAATAAWLFVPLWGQGAHNTGPKYDSTKEVKIKGVIEDIRDVPGEYEGAHLVVKTDTKTVLVHVAPSDFLKEIEASFKKGDEVVVIGSLAPNATEEEILAREITDGQNIVTLRDDKGVPIWAGWKPHKSSGK